MDSLAHNCAKVATTHGVSPAATEETPDTVLTPRQCDFAPIPATWFSNATVFCVRYQCMLCPPPLFAEQRYRTRFLLPTNHFPSSLNTVFHFEAVVSQCSPDGWVDDHFDGL